MYFCPFCSTTEQRRMQGDRKKWGAKTFTHCTLVTTIPDIILDIIPDIILDIILDIRPTILSTTSDKTSLYQASFLSISGK